MHAHASPCRPACLWQAYFYLDPYSRPAEKRGGAWMAEVVGQSKLLAPAGAHVRLPVAHMVCNQIPPIGEKPSLMTFRCGTVHAVHTCTRASAVQWCGCRLGPSLTGMAWPARHLDIHRRRARGD